MNGKQLTKGHTKMLSGVCSGIAEYFNIDATIIRLAFVLLGFTATGVVVYIAAALIMPEPPLDGYNQPTTYTQPDDTTPQG